MKHPHLQISHAYQKCPKIDSCSAWECTCCAGVHLQIFTLKNVNYAKKFSPLWGAGAPTAPPATPMMS